MVVLHTVWSRAHGLCLWAEHDEPRRRSRSGRHPFAAPPQRLASTVPGPAGDLLDNAEEVEVTVLLPTHAGRPLPSPQLLQGRPSSAGPPTLAPWAIAARRLDPVIAVHLLLVHPPVPGLGLAIGETFTHAQEMGRLALELAVRGRLVPALERDQGPWTAVWRAAPDPAARARLALLARSMPPLLRAEAEHDHEGAAPEAMLTRLLDSLVDGIAREALALADGPLLPPRAGRAGAMKAAEAWLLALAGEAPTVKAHPIDLDTLSELLARWRGNAVEDAPFRLCFRVQAPEDDESEDEPDEPTDPDAPWRVELLLQGRDDPSLIVPAADIWESGGGLPVFEHVIDHPDERLLQDLGRASRLFPDLDDALAQAHPAEVAFDAGRAHRFLRDTAPLLAAAGFGVLAPPWWGGAARLGLRLKTKRSGESDRLSGTSRYGLDGLCAYEWEVALGDSTLTEGELRELAALKRPLVRMRGRWVELRPEDANAALALLEQHGQMTAGDMLRLGLGTAPTVHGLPVLEVAGEGWIADFLKGTAGEALQPASAPPSFQGTLRPYQERGLAWLRFLGGLGLGACLADDMGLGKTVQLLSLLLAEREAGADAGRRPTLLVCPMSLTGNWQREAARFAPSLRVHVHHGAGRLRAGELTAASAESDLVVTTYQLVARDLEALKEIEWGRVVLDEAQNVKTNAALQTKAVRSLRASERVALTGTPVENRLTELWSIMEFLNPGLLGGYKEFKAHVAAPVERYRDQAAAARLKRITGPFILRRLKTDREIIADLPEKIEMKVFCNITREQATLYQAVLDDMMEKVASADGIERSGHVLAGLMKLKQALNHPAQLLRDGSRLAGRSGKLARAEETLEEVLAAGERALVFTQFAEMGELLRGHLAERFGREVMFLHGGTPRGRRDEMVERFQSSAGPPLFVLSLKAGGTGLNLTAANHVIHYDRWWNPAVEDQATDRAFRIGQRRDVQVRKLVCVGTLEERIDGMIEDKRALAEQIVGSGEAWLTQLSTAELREVVALSADAVGEG